MPGHIAPVQDTVWIVIPDRVSQSPLLRCYSLEATRRHRPQKARIHAGERGGAGWSTTANHLRVSPQADVPDRSELIRWTSWVSFRRSNTCPPLRRVLTPPLGTGRVQSRKRSCRSSRRRLGAWFRNIAHLLRDGHMHTTEEGPFASQKALARFQRSRLRSTRREATQKDDG